MDVEGYCKKCGSHFDGHWHQYPGEEVLRIFVPKCTVCGAEGPGNIRIMTDEEYHRRRS